jgi:hypothetical protein
VIAYAIFSSPSRRNYSATRDTDVMIKITDSLPFYHHFLFHLPNEPGELHPTRTANANKNICGDYFWNDGRYL